MHHQMVLGHVAQRFQDARWLAEDKAVDPPQPGGYLPLGKRTQESRSGTRAPDGCAAFCGADTAYALARDGGRVRRSSFFHRYSALSIYGRSKGRTAGWPGTSGERPARSPRTGSLYLRGPRGKDSILSPMLMLSGISCVTISVVTCSRFKMRYTSSVTFRRVR